MSRLRDPEIVSTNGVCKKITKVPSKCAVPVMTNDDEGDVKEMREVDEKVIPMTVRPAPFTRANVPYTVRVPEELT